MDKDLGTCHGSADIAVYQLPIGTGVSNYVLRLFPQVAAAAHRAGCDAAYRIHTVGCALDRAGTFPGVKANTQCYPRTTFVKSIAEALGHSEDSVRKQLSKGESIFWFTEDSRSGRVVRLAGQDYVARSLGLDSSDRRLAEFSVEGRELRSIRRFRALLVDASLPRLPRRMARKTVQSLSGVSPKSQVGYERDSISSYTDGAGRTPLDSPATYFQLPSRSSDGFDAPVIGMAQELNVPGLFAYGNALVRQEAKPFQSSAVWKHRSRLHRKTVATRIKRLGATEVYKVRLGGRVFNCGRNTFNIVSCEGGQDEIYDCHGKRVEVGEVVRRRQEAGLQGLGLIRRF